MVKMINRTVWTLSLVSLFADVASEMIYPIVPVYLKEIGFSVLLIGVLEGVANFTAGASKGYFGKWSDARGERLPFVRLGYFLSALSKPLLAASVAPLWIFFVRTTDRLGKGLRSAPRDALLAQQATAATRATVFGFHRSMDTLGAALGPVVALVLLMFFPGNFPLVFLVAFLPGIISVLLLFRIKEASRPAASAIRRGGFFSYFGYWHKAPIMYRKLVVGLGFFALFNSADVFLLLKTKEVTGSDTYTVAAYIFYNLVFALAAFPLGKLADRYSPRLLMVIGLSMFAIVYVLFGTTASLSTIVIAFFLYGLYAAATEGVAKAWISNLAESGETGTAIGLFTSCESIAALIASMVAGWVWVTWGSTTTFLLSAFASLLAAVFLVFFVSAKAHT